MVAIVWTDAYNPFMMGGNVNAPIGTKVKVKDIQPIGKGFHGILFETPKGSTRVAEATSGAIVGDTFDDVRKDIEEGDEELCKKQVEQAKDRKKNVVMLTNQEFFDAYKY